MKMTKALAEQLQDTLACIAISANGGCHIDENGEPFLEDDEIELIETYARHKFIKILNEWEDLKGEEWDIE